MTMPAARAIDPVLAATQGAVRAVRSWARVAEPASAAIPVPETMTLVEWNRWRASWGPSEKNRAAIDQEESTARPASTNCGRTTEGILGRWTVSRKRERPGTGSGIQ